MEARWSSTGGQVRPPGYHIPAHYLASSTNIFSEEFVRRLTLDLQPIRDQLAKQLGISLPISCPDWLYTWSNSPGSTVFVLVSVLANLGRADCIQRIGQFLESETVQLFVKVDTAVTEGCATMASPKFQHFLTNGHFSLLQALGNVMGDHLVYYEIAGPGLWVTWTTPTKELKGQQLTLVCHNQPVATTQAALSDRELTQEDTQLKQPPLTRNIPVDRDMDDGEETQLKALQFTQIENLKFSADGSLQASNSNNMLLSGSSSHLNSNPDSLLRHKQAQLSTKTDEDRVTKESQTQVKTLAEDNQNTPEHGPTIKHFPDKLFNKKHETGFGDQLTRDQNLLEALENMPHFSLLQDSFINVVENSDERPPSLERIQSSKMNNLSRIIPRSPNPQSIPVFTVKTQARVHSSSLGTPRLQAPIMDNSETQTTPMHSGASMPCENSYPSASSLLTHGRHSDSSSGVTCLEFSIGDPFQYPNENRSYRMDIHSPDDNSIVPPQAFPNLTQNFTDSSMLFEHLLDERRHNLHQHFLDVHNLKLKQSQSQPRLEQQIPASEYVNLPGRCFFNSTTHDGENCPPRQNERGNHFDSSKKTLVDSHNTDSSQLWQNQQEQQDAIRQQMFPTSMSQKQGLASHLMAQQDLYDHEVLLTDLPSPDGHLLMCHTPPPQFPDDSGQTPGSHDEADQRQQTMLLQSVPTSSYQIPGRENQMIVTQDSFPNPSFPPEQYLPMFYPGVARSSFRSISTRSNSSSQPFTTLQNIDFANPNMKDAGRLPAKGLHTRNFSDCSSNSADSFLLTRSEFRPCGLFTTPQPFHPVALGADVLGRRMQSDLLNETFPQDMEVNEKGSTGQHNAGFSSNKGHHLFRSKSFPTSSSHTTSMRPTPDTEDELLHLDGWSPLENGDTIQQTLEKYKFQDGSYVIWKSRRLKKYILSVTHLKQLFHFRVEESQPTSCPGTTYYLFEGGYTSASLLDLMRHYRQDGIRISMQSTGRQKTYIEIIRLLNPVHARLEGRLK